MTELSEVLKTAESCLYHAKEFPDVAEAARVLLVKAFTELTKAIGVTT